MKIAVCISGQPRAYIQGYEYLKRNLLDRYDCDIFIHTWNNSVYRTMDIMDLYHPTRWETENPLPKSPYNLKYTNASGSPGWPANATVSMFYSIFKSLLLKTQHELLHQQYDFVVKTRFDYALNIIIDFDKLNKTKLYIPNCRTSPTRDFGNDQFAFGSNRVMVDYMSTYLHMEHFYNSGYAMIGEHMLSANLRRCGLVGENLEYVDMNNPFLPGLHKGIPHGLPHSLIRDDMELWKNN